MKTETRKSETVRQLAVWVSRAARVFEVGEKEIMHDGRGPSDAAWARAVVMTLASGRMGMTQERIGKVFRRQSSCVSRAVTKVLELARVDREFSAKVEAVRCGEVGEDL